MRRLIVSWRQPSVLQLRGCAAAPFAGVPTRLASWVTAQPPQGSPLPSSLAIVHSLISPRALTTPAACSWISESSALVSPPVAAWRCRLSTLLRWRVHMLTPLAPSVSRWQLARTAGRWHDDKPCDSHVCRSPNDLQGCGVRPLCFPHPVPSARIKLGHRMAFSCTRTPHSDVNVGALPLQQLCHLRCELRCARLLLNLLSQEISQALPRLPSSVMHGVHPAVLFSCFYHPCVLLQACNESVACCITTALQTAFFSTSFEIPLHARAEQGVASRPPAGLETVFPTTCVIIVTGSGPPRASHFEACTHNPLCRQRPYLR